MLHRIENQLPRNFLVARSCLQDAKCKALFIAVFSLFLFFADWLHNYQLNNNPSFIPRMAKAIIKKRYCETGRGKREKFNRRQKSLFNKLYELSEICGVKCHTILQRNNKFFVFTSEEDVESWLPSLDKIVSWTQVTCISSNNNVTEEVLSPTHHSLFKGLQCGQWWKVHCYSWLICDSPPSQTRDIASRSLRSRASTIKRLLRSRAEKAGAIALCTGVSHVFRSIWAWRLEEKHVEM